MKPPLLHEHVQVRCCVIYRADLSEICVFSVDEEAERRQGRSQFGGLAAGCRQEGVVLQLLEGLQRGNKLLIQTHTPLQWNTLSWKDTLRGRSPTKEGKNASLARIRGYIRKESHHDFRDLSSL